MKLYKLSILSMTLLFLSGSFSVSLFDINLQAKYLLLIVALFTFLLKDDRVSNTLRVNIPNKLLFLLSVGFTMYTVLSASLLYSDNPNVSFTSLTDMIFSVILLLIVFLHVAGIEKDNYFNYLSGLLIVIGIAYIIPVYLGVLTGSDRGSSLGGPNVSTRIIFFAACCSMYRFKMTGKFIYSILSILFLCGILFIGSRGGLVGAITTIFVLLLFKYVLRKWRIKKKINISFKKIIFTIIGFTVILYLFEPLKRVYETRIASTLFRGSEGVYTAGRDMLYLRALEMIKEKPIFGHGLNGFATSSFYNYPHNFLLELMVDIGILGVIFFILLLVFAISIIIRYKNTDMYMFSGLPLYMILVQMFSGGLFDFRYYFFWAIPLLYYAGKPSLEKKFKIRKQEKNKRKYKVVW